jgi:hypothetical protein
MFIDDLINDMARSGFRNLPAQERDFFQSIHLRIARDQPLTTRQCYKAKTVLNQYRELANAQRQNILCPSYDLTTFRATIDQGLWKNQPVVRTEKRSEARYLGDNIVALSYSPSADMTLYIPSLRQQRRGEVCVMAVTELTLDPLIDFLGRFGFEIDDDLERFLALCLDSRKAVSEMVMHEGALVGNIRDSETLAAFLQQIMGAERL